MLRTLALAVAVCALTVGGCADPAGDGSLTDTGTDASVDASHDDLASDLGADSSPTDATTDSSDTDTVTMGTCGDGRLDADELCDGAALGGGSCAALEGFIGGTLRCDPGCQAYDTALCTPAASCGDGQIGANEECDGANLGGATCQSLGFVGGGALGCQASCRYEVSGCVSGGPFPAAGELVVTEIMVDAEGFAMGAGEYIELYNPSTTAAVTLEGCRLHNGSGAEHLVTSALEVTPGARVTLARSAQPGFSPDYVYGPEFGFATAAGAAGAVRIVCPATGGGDAVVDQVEFDTGARFPRESGFAMSLGLAHTNAAANDDGLRWCLSPAEPGNASYDGQNFGTPGAANFDCAIGWCIIQWPRDICDSGCEASGPLPVTAYGRVFADGRTNLSSGPDPDPRLVAQVGVGPLGDDPRVGDGQGFTWTAASINPGFTDPLNDEYQASLGGLPSGLYSYFFRFSYDGGQRWQYCDVDGATPQGAPDPEFDPEAAGLIEVP